MSFLRRRGRRARAVTCPRCATKLVERDAQNARDGHQFFECTSCGRHFTKHPDGELTERWPGPISLALYPVIFSANPQDDAEQVAHSFRNDHIDQKRSTIVAIDEELAAPTQRVSRIHIFPLQPTEEEVRGYLRRLADLLRSQIEEARDGG